ncbi:unnamed protein product, partial [Ectocarpus sp. 12 AP-2014]
RPEGFLVCADHIQGLQEWLRTEKSAGATATASKADDTGHGAGGAGDTSGAAAPG